MLMVDKEKKPLVIVTFKPGLATPQQKYAWKQLWLKIFGKTMENEQESKILPPELRNTKK
jgi:hypothetical protein